MTNDKINKFLEELAVSKAWSDDFASAIKTEEDLEVLKIAAGFKNNKGERLYDNFQLFQFLGDDKAQKLELAEKFLRENPEFTNQKYNMPVINYIIRNKLSEEDIDMIIKNAHKADFIKIN